MKGAYLVSEDDKFFQEIVQNLVRAGAEYQPDGDRMVQLKDSGGRYLTIYGDVADRYFSEDWSGPFVPADDSVRIPDLRAVAACSVECRWNDLFVATVRRLARELTHPFWVLDEMDVVWNADAVDVKRLVL